jgi:hypothetical protein
VERQAARTVIEAHVATQLIRLALNLMVSRELSA